MEVRGGNQPIVLPTVSDTRVFLKPIASEDAAAVSRFFHENLNSGVPASAWRPLLTPPWDGGKAPNHGFQLIADDSIVGAYAAVYSSRTLGGRETTVCNLAAFCVVEQFRAHSLRLVRALLGQKDMLFTDLSPSGNVIAMNERLGFQHLDTTTRILVNLPLRVSREVRFSSDPSALSSTLIGPDATIYQDHRAAPAARHLLAKFSGGYLYLMYRRHRMKRLPIFALPLYVGGDKERLEALWPLVTAHLFRRGFPATLAETRLVGFSPSGMGITLSASRPRMVRGRGIDMASLDYSYSELTLLEW